MPPAPDRLPLPPPSDAAPGSLALGAPLILHIANGTSGLAPHMALLAARAEFEVRPLELMRGEHRQPAFLRLNPFGTVPVLEDGDLVIPETGAILLHVAERFPAAGLLPQGGAARALALRWMFHTAALHADFMTWRRSMFRFGEDDAARTAVQGWMADRLGAAFRATDQAMAGPYLVGDAPCVADFYLLMVAGWWRSRFAFAAETPCLAAMLTSLCGLAYVQQAYAAQGSDLPRFAMAHDLSV